MAKGSMRPAKEKRKPKAEKNKKPKGGTTTSASPPLKTAGKS